MKKKIIHILNTGSYSGAENVVITIIRNTSDIFDCTYVSLDGSIRQVLQDEGIAFHPVDRLSIKNIKAVIRSLRPDVIHAHDFTAGILACLSTRKIPVIVHLHNDPPWIKRFNLRSIAFALCCKKCAKVLTVSPSVMEEYIFRGRFADKSQVIGNPIDIAAIRSKADPNDHTHSSDVIFLGRLSEQKDPLDFLEIIALVKKKIPDLTVAMVGEGELRPQVENKIVQLELETTVTLYGFQSDPYTFLRNSKVMCMPSRWEGFGLAAVEALVFGKPVIASPVGGLPGIVDDSCGSLCKTNEDFADQLCRYLLDETLYAQKSEGALQKAQRTDNIKGYIERLITIYQSFDD